MTSLLAATAAALLLPGAPTDVAALQRTLHRQGAALAATLCITLATTDSEPGIVNKEGSTPLAATGLEIVHVAFGKWQG